MMKNDFATESDIGAYILGILWGTMGAWREGYWLRHRDRWYIEAVREILNISAAIQEVASYTGPQCRLKIVRGETVEFLGELLKSHGWQPRNAQERPYPSGIINDRGFIRAWVELHGSADIRQAKHRNGLYYPQKRLRIYGNWALMEEMNQVLSVATGLMLRTLQPSVNEITKILHYQGSSVAPVIAWLYDGAEIYNPAARDRLEFK